MNISTKNKNSALVVLSGGQDSTTCLLWALKNYENVKTVSFDYGQRHAAELQCAAKICEKFGVTNKVIDLSELNALAPNSLTRDDIEVDSDAPEEGTPNSFVEGRNMLFLTYAAIYAKGEGITDIITGVSQSDFSGYPDCRDIFIKSLNVTLNLAMDYEFDIITPLMWIDKEETWALADSLGGLEIIRDMTLTCYNGIMGEGCGNCPACKLRRAGYEKYMSHRSSRSTKN
ncbi:MAG: 7-cyano-7-deazaguanine synthase QueC [Eubacterium sp.]|nr:7-cyano-7-deazaguanine synthase QueC [Eubacterium sp.]